MTKKEFLEMEAFKALPDDAEIVFNTSRHPEARVPLTEKRCWYEKCCTNIGFIKNAPVNIRDQIKPQYGCFFIINAMPSDYLENVYHMTFEL